MNYFITSETTADVTHAELSALLDFEDELNRLAADLQIRGVDRVGIVLVVMNPEIAEPFPPGVVFRRSRRELDIKPAVPFSSWKAAGRLGRIGLVIEAIIAALRCRPVKGISKGDIIALDDALNRGHRGLVNEASEGP